MKTTNPFNDEIVRIDKAVGYIDKRELVEHLRRLADLIDNSDEVIDGKYPPASDGAVRRWVACQQCGEPIEEFQAHECKDV